MKKSVKVHIVLALMFVFLCLISVVFAQNQEFITESKCEEMLQKDPLALEANLETNATVVIPTEQKIERVDSVGSACTGNRWWYALLVKKVKNADGKWIDNAIVTISLPDGAKVKVRWWDSWTTGSCSVGGHSHRGFAWFWLKWNGQSNKINITITVSKDGYSTVTETVTIKGLTFYYPNFILNELRPSPSSSVPEFSIITPLAVSIYTSVYLAMRRRRK